MDEVEVSHGRGRVSFLNLNGQVWVMETILQHLSPVWPQCFAA
jgi:hypothetical protein